MTTVARLIYLGFWLAALGTTTGCRSDSRPHPSRFAEGTSPTAVGLQPSALIDPVGYGDGPGLPVARDLFRVGERIRVGQRPIELPARKSCLCLSGGGAFGACQAGLLVGWTELGTRPDFDAVTGVSTGALVAVLAFLGPDYDPELRRVYTTLRTEDIYTRKRGVRSLFSN
jgi:hypothetical protein